jgi:5'-nucleotidase
LPQGALRARLAEARFPLLSANLFGPGGTLPAWKNLFPRKLVRVGGVDIGFVGVLTRETPSIVMPDYFAGLSVGELGPAVIAEAQALRREGAEAVIVIAHAGAECGRFDDPHDLESCDAPTSELCSLVRDVPQGLVDAWFGGHTHSGIGHYVNGAPVVEAFSRGKAFGRIDLELSGDPRRVVSARPFAPEPLCPDSAELAPCETHAYAGQIVEPSRALAGIVQPVLDWARRERERSLNVVIEDRLGAEHDVESGLGNLFSDLMLGAIPGSDLALTNGGSLRAPIPAGTLSYGTLYEAMPFDNRIVQLSLSGAELKAVLRAHLAHEAHGLVSLAGIAVKVRCSGDTLDVTLRRNNGRAIADDERLLMVTSDYLATGGDRLFLPLGEARSRIVGAPPILLRDALASEVSKRARIRASDVLDRRRPRLDLPSPRPVRCAR